MATQSLQRATASDGPKTLIPALNVLLQKSTQGLGFRV